ncbi:MAG: hypothetical protein M3Y44_16730 [Actinomycetota bacterium]|nr:hypothetical protein [Actinomycetota bacterium]
MFQNAKCLGFLPGWRMFTYAIVATNLLMLIWLIASVTSAERHAGCGPLETMTCTSGTNAGPRIAALLVVTIWILVNLILGALWVNTGEDRARRCDECRDVAEFGRMGCGRCAPGASNGLPRYSTPLGRDVPHS